MEPIFDRTGRVCAWLRDDTLRDMHGKVVGFLTGQDVLSLAGHHLGWLADGHFRDARGAVVGWRRKAVGGPVKPMPAVPPRAPVPARVPVHPRSPVPPRPPVPSSAWSSQSWEAFLQH